MEKNEILNQIQAVMRGVFNNDGITLSEETTVADVESWDSLSRVQLAVALEKHFNIKFSSKEILSWKNVGELIQSIKSRQDCV
jgi:acyl carrier protein